MAALSRRAAAGRRAVSGCLWVLAACGPYAQVQPAATPSPCDTYCALVMGACVGGQQLFDTVAACAAACAGYGAGGGAGDQAGDTLQCRLTFAAAAHAAPSSLCAAAGPASAACRAP